MHQNHVTAVDTTDPHATTKTGRAVPIVVETTASIAVETTVDATLLSARNEAVEDTNIAADLARLGVKATNVMRKTANTDPIEIATMIGRTEDVKTRIDAVIGIGTTMAETEIVTRIVITDALSGIILLNVRTPRVMRRSKYALTCHLHLRRRKQCRAR